MNPKTLIFEDVKDKYQELKEFINHQSLIYDCSKRELLKYINYLVRKELNDKH
jgi:hypothetical protein